MRLLSTVSCVIALTLSSCKSTDSNASLEGTTPNEPPLKEACLKKVVAENKNRYANYPSDFQHTKEVGVLSNRHIIKIVSTADVSSETESAEAEVLRNFALVSGNDASCEILSLFQIKNKAGECPDWGQQVALNFIRGKARSDSNSDLQYRSTYVRTQRNGGKFIYSYKITKGFDNGADSISSSFSCEITMANNSTGPACDITNVACKSTP
jgi:hypothetical protein